MRDETQPTPARAYPASAFRAPTDEEQRRLHDINYRISKAAFDAALLADSERWPR